MKVYIPPHSSEEFKNSSKSYGVSIAESGNIYQIKPGIFISGELCGKTKKGNIYEQYLVIKSSQGLIVMTGCAHPGIVNIVKDSKEKFNEDIFILMGGFHLRDKEGFEILKIIKELKNLGAQRVAPLHCTGREAVNQMKEEFGKSFIILKQHEPLVLT